MNTPNNRRMQMSKAMIRDSLIELLETASIEQISVRKLCENANVNRSTFYKYYSSQYELLDEIENELLFSLDYGVSRADGGINYIQLLEFVAEHKREFRTLLSNHTNTAFEQKIIALPAVTNQIEHRLNGRRYSKTEILYMKKLIINGGLELIRTWLTNDCKESPDEVSEIFCRLLGAIAEHF